jgi:hypothetical protein
MSTEREKVARGMAHMDEVDPPWWRADVERAIDLDRLDLASTELDILGQRCPIEVLAAYGSEPVHRRRRAKESRENGFFAYAHVLSGIAAGPDGPEVAFDCLIEWAIERGFTARTEAEFKPLAAEWSERIRERRAAA